MRGKARDEGQHPRLGVAGKGNATDAGGSGVRVFPGQRCVAKRKKPPDDRMGVVIGRLDGIGAGGHVAL